MDFSGWEKLSLLDYDHHVASSLFFAGCNFRCPYCHNKTLVINPSSAPIISWDEIYNFFKKRKGMIEGICISGGEPTLMTDLMEKISLLKELGYQIKLDTNGSNPKILKEVVKKKLIDYVAMDIKNCPKRYKETIGLKQFSLAGVQESISFLRTNPIDYEFRTTIMEEFHDEEAIREIGEWIYGAPRYFLQRYIDNENCIVGGFHPVSKEKAMHYQGLLKDFIREVNLRGYD